jgi:dihydrofolate reductase
MYNKQDNYNPEGCIVVSSMEKASNIYPRTSTYTSLVGEFILNFFSDKIELTQSDFEADAFQK